MTEDDIPPKFDAFFLPNARRDLALITEKCTVDINGAIGLAIKKTAELIKCLDEGGRVVFSRQEPALNLSPHGHPVIGRREMELEIDGNGFILTQSPFGLDL